MLFRSVVSRGVINEKRRNDLWQVHPLSSLLACYQCSQYDEHVSYGSSGVAVPPFSCTFTSAPQMHNVLAVANEEGVVRLYDTESRKTPVLKEWLAHDNAVFDMAWVPGEPRLVSASGDQMARLWDVISGELLGTFKGHQCSLKSVAFTKQEKHVFCTGGRDGNIMVWDTRCSKRDGFYRQVKQISGAHNKCDGLTPSKGKRKKPMCRGMSPSVDSQQSVTVVLFRDTHTLISSGAVDGTIKMWDLRKSYTVYQQEPSAMQVFNYPGSSTRKLGYSDLTLDSTGTSLFSNCTDDNIYMFNITGLKTSPVAVFTGHLNSSFYVKSTVSPDNQFLASGSSDHHIYVWKISDPSCSPIMLQGHCQEVTSVAWCPTDFTKIASCSDDNAVRIWRMRRRVEEDDGRDEENVVGWARVTPVSTCEAVRSPGQTPAKTSQLEGVCVSLSPQPGVFVPSGSEVPVSPKRTSIRAWVTRPTPTSQRVKRRLEAGGVCVGEHGHTPKRMRATMSGDQAGQQSASVPPNKHADKENSAPSRTHWLLDMKQKMRGSQTSPSSSKSPTSVRKQESRSSSSPTLSPMSMKKISFYFQRIPE